MRLSGHLLPPVLLALLLAGCGDGAEAPPRQAAEAEATAAPPAATPAPADDSAIDKAVARDLYKAGRLGLNDHRLSGSFDIYQCGSLPIDAAERMDPRAAAQQQLAAAMVQLEGDLAAAGYDPGLTAAPLAAYEAGQRQALADGPPQADDAAAERQDAALRALADTLNAARADRQPGLPPIVAEGGCGDGEAQQPFLLQPKDGVAQVLRAFSFEVCARRRIDPWDAARCPGWLSVRDGQSLPLAGAYRVQARWPDGRTLRSDFVTQGFDEADRAAPVRLTAPAAPAAPPARRGG